ncbi:pyrroline-5-carboxylate reductase [Mytilus galloprovincialis]|uniref:Pyrroline-5-carboxylate reductase n=1 Tax=Mytilus galloprovincialis TaxID=29158 RepID=A0A8B6H2Q3_MYTGA|nr:pyrroline-5-carboxylate reductase [Mytilus galloprovincialis]
MQSSITPAAAVCQKRKYVSEDMTIGFIGAGKMAQAMTKGFVTSGIIKGKNITLSDVSASNANPRMLQFVKEFGVTTTQDNKEVVNKSQVVVISVKPNVVNKVLKEVKEHVSKDKIVVSIAAGVPLSTFEQNLPPGSRVVRVMPNITVTVQAAASVVAPGTSVQLHDSELVRELFQSIGICEIGSEYLLDAVTGLSGSGPAYGFIAIESLADGGVNMGLPRDLALKLAAQTLLGAAKMVLESGKHPGQLKDDVCSPGGTTIAAVQSLEKSGFRSCLIGAVEAATLKAQELGSKNK